MLEEAVHFDNNSKSYQLYNKQQWHILHNNIDHTLAYHNDNHCDINHDYNSLASTYINKHHNNHYLSYIYYVDYNNAVSDHDLHHAFAYHDLNYNNTLNHDDNYYELYDYYYNDNHYINHYIDHHQTTTTTTTITTQPFCSATPIQSLLADTGAYQFCWDLLAIATPTTISTVFETPTETTVFSNHIPITLTSFVPVSTITTMTLPTTTLTAELYSTMCVGSVPYKRDLTSTPLIRAGIPAQTTPIYLANEPQNYQASACGCITNLPAPPEVTDTTTSTLPTVTTVTTLDVTDTFSTTETTITGTNTITTAQNTVYTTTFNAATSSGTFGPPASTFTVSYTTNNVASTTTYILRPSVMAGSNSSPSYNNAGSCSCSSSGSNANKWTCTNLPGQFYADPSGKCINGHQLCLQNCMWANGVVPSRTCNGVYYYENAAGTSGSCTGYTNFFLTAQGQCGIYNTAYSLMGAIGHTWCTFWRCIV
ncbi:hypothetical protein KVT40_007578 [Elsinoe batatas]|uniref:Uncharacterized protein n=1 Tax=Elsinoe batatas TaxID=2601811 RepID=A0A8K0PCF3_9PEZI|nr:hypothetical protein KVT40_007578 [Elsinoe batatas]